jgi:hypothetical protein
MSNRLTPRYFEQLQEMNNGVHERQTITSHAEQLADSIIPAIFWTPTPELIETVPQQGLVDRATAAIAQLHAEDRHMHLSETETILDENPLVTEHARNLEAIRAEILASREAPQNPSYN